MTERELTFNNSEDDDVTYCAVHTDRETGLRCNKCDRYMCGECAVQTPVGYRCKQCVRQHEDLFFRGTNRDYVVAGAVSLALGAVAGAVASAFGFFFILIFLSFIAGGFISEAGLRVTERRRGRYSGEVNAVAVFVGMISGVAIRAYLQYQDRFGAIIAEAERRNLTLPEDILPPLSDFIISDITSLGMLIFIGVVTFTVYSRYRT